MSGVFRNIDPPTPHRTAFDAGEDTLAGWRGGGGVNTVVREDPRHCSVFYICKYFVLVRVYIAVQPRFSNKNTQRPFDDFRAEYC
jgi:hypothetical protein